MARYSKTLTAETQAAFLSALRGGAQVVDAARVAGVAVSTLYWRRKADPLFAFAWEAAAELSAGAVGRRLRFGERRRALLLAAFEATCNLRGAGRETGVHPAIVYRHLLRDRGFAANFAATLQRGYVQLEQKAAAAKEAQTRAWRRALAETVPTIEMTTDFDEIMRLLARYGRPDGSVGLRSVRRERLKSTSFDEAMELLARRLRALGYKPAEMEEGGAGLKRHGTIVP